MSLISASRGVASSSESENASPVPQTLGKYRVLLELGRGGMANVYLAVARGAHGVSKLVVLKALLPDYAAEPEACAMFLDEARLAAQLNHGNVVQTYEVGEEQGRHVIVMEYLEGQSLAAVLRRARRRERPLPLGLHLRILLHVLDGLHYTHELRGYDGAPLHPVHRDVSPQNVFVTYDGRAKLLDFGIAKAASSTTHTATGLIKGKIAYMSPEQMAGQVVDRRADVYAVGCMLWAAAAGSKLWKDRTDVSILNDVVHDAIPSPRVENPECDPDLERIVMKALAKLSDRYATALELHDDLERYCEAKGYLDRPRELGRLVIELFQDDRAELQARIEARLALRTNVTASAALPLTSPLEEGTATQRDHGLTTATGTMSASTLNAAPPVSAGRGPWRWVVGAVLAASAAAYLLVGRASSPAPGATSSPTILSATNQVDVPSTITIAFGAKPSAARLFLNDVPVPGNPATRVVPRDGVLHRVRAELTGYRTASAELVATRDQELTFDLEPMPVEPKSPEPAPSPKRASAPAAPRTVSARPRNPNCAQPFYVDAEGIKKIKPACL